MLTPLIIIRKAARTLAVESHGDVLFRCNIALGFAPVGHKKREGDGRTPEGCYQVSSRNPDSKYYKSLGLSYPNPMDARNALKDGMIDAATCALIERNPSRPPWDTPLGGFIMIHGGGSKTDWTHGCIALENEDMEQLWRICGVGTRVIIYS